MSLATSDDTRLMGDVTAGSVQAFSGLYDRFRNRAHQVALSDCRDEGHAQDAVQVLKLTYFGELSNAEIACRLGLPAGTVKGRIRLGLQKLRTNIEQDAA